ncbi:glycosyltransferase family A protein [Methanolobus sediminis]|uniref:Glycosyltransferase family A protein n=1 Tax=Methanolobus sediminis TaxID=3072978 RepID=A0AA51YLX4_9EURY|nr:glycosyltransferase family A protein [Methanolobus sediminis]WMW25424.1 glycosyltransferase family A protein [Methanolobus sediminis]
MPEVSVVIPLYNKASYIERALNSVLNQNITDIEIIVVDDGSTDNGPELVKQFNDPRIIYVKQKNSGVSAARNKGIIKSKADLIAFLDSDDEWMPHFLETVLYLKEKYPQAGLYATALKTCNEENSCLIPNHSYLPFENQEGIIDNYFSIAIKDFYFGSSSVLIPKNIFREVGIFENGVWWGEDLDMWGRIALKYPIAFSKEIGAIYHLNSSNRAGNREDIVDEHIFIPKAKSAIRQREVSEEMKYSLQKYIIFLEYIRLSRNIRNEHINGDLLKFILNNNARYNYKIIILLLVTIYKMIRKYCFNH